MVNRSMFHRAAACAGAPLAGLMLVVPAHAAFSGDVTISLLAPGGFVGSPTPIGPGAASDVVSPADGLKITPGDGTGIGGLMLPLEQISFAGNSIHVTVAAGSGGDGGSPLVTGYLGDAGVHARYEFTGLAIAGEQIVGLTLSAADGFSLAGPSGIISPASPTDYIHLISPHSLSIDLDTLVFGPRGAGPMDSYGDLRIDLVTTPVPEPSAASLALAGLLGLAVLYSRRRVAASRRED